MIRPVVSIFILLFFASCIEESPSDIPKQAPLSENEFKDVLMEIYLINAYITNNNKQGEIHRDSAFLYVEALLSDMGKSTEDLEKSILYYSSFPFVLDSIVQVVRDTLEHKFLQISHDELENNDSTSSFKSVLKNYPYLNSHNVNKNFIFNSSSKDSIIDYFSKHPELLGNYSFEEFVYSVNNMKKNNHE